MEYLTTEQVCEKLKISKKKAYELYKVKGFPYVKIGRDYRVQENKLDAFLQNYESSTIYIK